MKQFLLMATMLLALGVAKAQISDVQQKGNYLNIYNDKNQKICDMYIDVSREEFMGFGNSFYVVQSDNYLKVYDSNCKKISDMYIDKSRQSFKSASGNSFNIKSGSYIVTYDKYCKKISERYAN